MRCFQKLWYDEFPWLEYSVAYDTAHCFYCYLFALRTHKSDAFTSKGFNNWKKGVLSFREHAGKVGGAHNDARLRLEDFKNQKQSIVHVFTSSKLEARNDYRIRLTASLHVVRFLLMQGLSFRGHDERKDKKGEKEGKGGNFQE